MEKHSQPFSVGWVEQAASPDPLNSLIDLNSLGPAGMRGSMHRGDPGVARGTD